MRSDVLYLAYCNVKNSLLSETGHLDFTTDNSQKKLIFWMFDENSAVITPNCINFEPKISKRVQIEPNE